MSSHCDRWTLRFVFLTLFLFLTLACCVTSVHAADLPKPATKATKPAPPKPRTGKYIYKKQPYRTMTIYYPDDWKPTDKRPTLVIFRCNIPAQREHFRKRGMVIIKPLLAPVNSGNLPKLSLEAIAKLARPRHQVEDVKSAIRFIRLNAAKMGVDSNRIAATGTSGGGDLALQGFINTEYEDDTDDQTVSHQPNALVLYCPAFDGINIWFVKMDTLYANTKANAPAFLPLLDQFIKNTTDTYATPVDHKVNLIDKAATLGKAKGIDAAQIKAFQEVLDAFNKRDWQLLHPWQEALHMSASRILTKEPLPPTLLMYGTRDHLREHQDAFVKRAKELGQKFELHVIEGGGHSFMMQPYFEKPTTNLVDAFLVKHGYLE